MRAQLLVVHRAGHLRPPVVQSAEEGDYRAAHHHVVEMRDDEVSVGQVDVGGKRAEEDAGQAADGEQQQEVRWRTASALPAMMLPLYIVASQLNTLMPDGIATRNVRNEKITVASSDLPGDEHVVAPHQEATSAMATLEIGDGAVAEDRLSARTSGSFR